MNQVGSCATNSRLMLHSAIVVGSARSTVIAIPPFGRCALCYSIQSNAAHLLHAKHSLVVKASQAPEMSLPSRAATRWIWIWE